MPPVAMSNDEQNEVWSITDGIEAAKNGGVLNVDDIVRRCQALVRGNSGLIAFVNSIKTTSSARAIQDFSQRNIPLAESKWSHLADALNRAFP